MGGLRIFAFVAVFAPLSALAAPTAQDVKLSLSRAAATAARNADITVSQAADPGACDSNLASSSQIDARLAWARSVESCLEGVAEALRTEALLATSASARGSILATQSQIAPSLEVVRTYRAALQGEKDFIGIKWGVGVGYSHGFDDIIEDAEIANGVVRVKKDLTDQPRVILEFHSYLWCHAKREGDVPIEKGCGPFAAVATRDDKAVSGVAAGFMYGWKTGTGANSSGFSVGVGVILDSGVKKLEDGFREGQPPPAGATTVLLKEESIASAVLFFTRTF